MNFRGNPFAMLQRMGISVKQIKAKRVIIELEDGSKILFEEPDVSAMNLQGVNVYQVVGNEKTINYSEEDINLVMQQANVSREEAIKYLEKHNGDLAEAIDDILNNNN